MTSQTTTDTRDAEIASLKRRIADMTDSQCYHLELLKEECDRSDRLHAQNLTLKCRVTMLEAACAMAQKCRAAGK